MTAHTRPDWMDAKWLARQAAAKGTPSYAAMAREIIHQEAELAERTRQRDAAEARFQAAWGECAKYKTELDAARADIAAAQRILPAGCGSLADAADTMRQELEAARAEVERLRGIVDDIASWTGHSTMLDDEAHEPPPLPDLVRDIVRDRDAAIRDRNEFAAREVERFAEEFLGVMKSHGVADAVEALPGAADNRAAELRAGAVPAEDIPPPPNPGMELSGRMTIAGVRHRDGRAFNMVGAEGVGGRTNTVVIVVDDAVPATEHVADAGKKVETTVLREPRPGNATLAIRIGANTMWTECAIEKLGEDAAFAAGVMMRRHGAVPATEPQQIRSPKWTAEFNPGEMPTGWQAEPATEPKTEPAAEPSIDAIAAMRAREKKFAEDLRVAINRNSAERIGGDTPDHLLAEFLVKCLEAFGMCTRSRTAWHVAERAGGAS